MASRGLGDSQTPSDGAPRNGLGQRRQPQLNAAWHSANHDGQMPRAKSSNLRRFSHRMPHAGCLRPLPRYSSFNASDTALASGLPEGLLVADGLLPQLSQAKQSSWRSERLPQQLFFLLAPEVPLLARCQRAISRRVFQPARACATAASASITALPRAAEATSGLHHTRVSRQKHHLKASVSPLR